MAELVNNSLLDLSSLKSIHELGAHKIINSGTLVVPERLVPELTELDFTNSGILIPLPDGVRVERWPMDMYAGGEDLAAGDEDAILFIGGALYITSPVERVGYRQIMPRFTTFIPQGSEGVIRAKLSHLSGPTFSYRYPPGARTIATDETIGRAFLEMLPEPTPLMVCRELTFSNDVTAEVLRQKVTEIILLGGTIHTTAHLLPVIQLLTTQKYGDGTIKSSAAGAAGVGRDIYSTETFSKEYLELLPDPLRINVYGTLKIEADVTPELFDAKVIGITTYGMTKAPKALVPLIQMKGDTYGQVVGY